MKTHAALFCALCLALASGCGDQVDTEESNGSCPSPPQVLTGTTPNGGECEDDADCLPICCPCPGLSPDEYLAAECLNGKCSSDATTCNDTDENSGLCSAG